MRASPSSVASAVSLRFQLYRTARQAVIWAGAALLLAQIVTAQAGPSGKKHVKGPRAVGLIELQAKGKARLIPITILVDGEYYDAGAYKADPVPMALDSGTVYEGYKDGVSQGLLTVAGALSAPNNVWLGEGPWQTTEELAAKKAKKPESAVPRGTADSGFFAFFAASSSVVCHGPSPSQTLLGAESAPATVNNPCETPSL